MTSSDLFAFGVSTLRLQAQPSQVELAEVYDALPEFRLSCSEVDRMAGIDFEARTEAQRNCPTRPNRKTD